MSTLNLLIIFFSIWIIFGFLYTLVIYPYWLRTKHDIVMKVTYNSFFSWFKNEFTNILIWPLGVYLAFYLNGLFHDSDKRKMFIEKMQDRLDKSDDSNGTMIDLS